MLPEKMLEGLPRIFLHDSRITQFFQTDNILTIEFDADNDGGLRKVNLVYQNPKVINLPSENVLGNGIDDGDSDLMCHEIEAIEESLYLHSMLFASGEELVIQFGALNVRYRDIV